MTKIELTASEKKKIEKLRGLLKKSDLLRNKADTMQHQASTLYGKVDYADENIMETINEIEPAISRRLSETANKDLITRGGDFELEYEDVTMNVEDEQLVISVPKIVKTMKDVKSNPIEELKRTAMLLGYRLVKL